MVVNLKTDSISKVAIEIPYAPGSVNPTASGRAVLGDLARAIIVLGNSVEIRLSPLKGTGQLANRRIRDVKAHLKKTYAIPNKIGVDYDKTNNDPAGLSESDTLELLVTRVGV